MRPFEFVIIILLFASSFLNGATSVLYHDCSSTKTFTRKDYNYLHIIQSLMASLSLHANNTAQPFYNTSSNGSTSTEPYDTIYGLYMCDGGVSPQLCGECVSRAARQLLSLCPAVKEAIIWYDNCFVRLSNGSFSAMDLRPRSPYPVAEGDSAISCSIQGRFRSSLTAAMNETAAAAVNSTVGVKNYARKRINLPGSGETVNCLAQCTPGLTSTNCSDCLSDAIDEIRWCSAEGGVVSPSCFVKYKVDLPKGKRNKSHAVIIIVVVSIVVLVMLICFGCYFLRRKERKRSKLILRENFGDESTTLESLQFDLDTIEAATNKFSNENMIGKGGFGEVYKGVLHNGQEIAVKRLSKSSVQGAVEFKNEILLIAKLQHRNLVALLGFCLEEQEKILIYEYVPNRSLDYILFDSKRHQLLSWSERFKIIGGIARAILYLHEYSRLKIIHRDLKPSNVLLDNDMNPKISDFGMTRIVALNQDQGSTMRIVGTYGYMPPEYAMFGQFSDKSDVFSFGVMVLEIISGKRNSNSYEAPHFDGLLNYTWRQWKDQRPLEILDPNMKDCYSNLEVTKSIQIGLLCVQENPKDRLTMTSVVSYLSNLSVELPCPGEPTFFMHGRMEPHMVAPHLDFGQSTNSYVPSSINEISC